MGSFKNEVITLLLGTLKTFYLFPSLTITEWFSHEVLTIVKYSEILKEKTNLSLIISMDDLDSWLTSLNEKTPSSPSVPRTAKLEYLITN